MLEDTYSFNSNYETGLECSVAGFNPDVMAVMHCPFYPVTETAELGVSKQTLPVIHHCHVNAIREGKET